LENIVAESPRSKNARSKDFRYIYANGLAVQFGNNDVALIFGVKEDQATNDEHILEEVAVMMTPLTAKNLAISLTKIIEHFEMTSGVVIPIEQAKIDSIDNALMEAALAMQKLNPSPTS